LADSDEEIEEFKGGQLIEPARNFTDDYADDFEVSPRDEVARKSDDGFE
jgi:hypothetical protein